MSNADAIAAYIHRLIHTNGKAFPVAVGMAADKFHVTREQVRRVMEDRP